MPDNTANPANASAPSAQKSPNIADFALRLNAAEVQGLLAVLDAVGAPTGNKGLQLEYLPMPAQSADGESMPPGVYAFVEIGAEVPRVYGPLHLVAGQNLPAPDPRTPADMRVNGGALLMALNALRRSGRTEIADEVVRTCVRAE